MELETIAKILIILHASMGGIALIGGTVALIAKKGSKSHRQSGKVFYIAMLLSCVAALIVAIIPNHKNPFLFAIGVFSIYLILTGQRALTFKQTTPNLTIDKIISTAMIITGIGMITLPLILSGVINIILSVLGTIGLIFAIRDLTLYQTPKRLKSKWLKLHIGKMTGGFIAAVSGFVVVNQLLPGLFAWFVPSVLGGLVITFWMRKVGKLRSQV